MRQNRVCKCSKTNPKKPDAHQLELTSEKRQFIAVPRVGRSSEMAVGDLDLAEPKAHSAAQQIPLNKILNNIYSDMLKRQGFIPTPRVGRSMLSSNADASRQQAALDFYANLMNRYPAYAENRFKRSPLLADAAGVENVNDAFETVFNDYNQNLITKRHFLPSPRIGERLRQSDLQFDPEETLALNQLTSNTIDGSSSDSSSSSLSNLGNYLQEESNMVEPIDLRTMSKIIKWYQNKNKQLLANALSEKRANAFSSRLGRSAPLTPRLGRSYWGEAANEDGSDSSEHNDRPYYDSPINNRIIRTALTPRIGKRSTNLAKTEEKVI